MDKVLIPLTRGYFATIDKSDYDLVSQYKWRTCGTKEKKLYAETGRSPKTMLMHRFLLGLTDPAIEVDHKNGDGLNNCRENIRQSTRSQNNMNRKSWTGTYKGVRVIPTQYKAVINVGGRRINTLGLFDTPEQAAMAYDAAAKKYHGEFASLNFGPGMIPPLPSNAGLLAGLV